MRKLSTTTRITISLAFLTVTLLLAADVGRVVPDVIGAELRGREALCEAVALSASQQIVGGELASAEKTLGQLAARNPQILSAAVRRADGSIVTELGAHSRYWNLAADAPSTPTQVRVPVFQDNRPWGTVELRFAEIQGAAWGPLRYPLARMAAFVFFGGLLMYRLYLRRVLQYLDPSQVIPERVKLMLDTLAEGVLVVDPQGLIVLANQAFASVVGQSPHDLLGVPASRFGWTEPQQAGDEESATPAPLDDEALPWTQALDDGAVRRAVPLSLRRSDGTLNFTVNAAPITAGGRTVQGALVTFDDVTAIERKNVQLQDMLRMLRASRDEIDRQNAELQRLAMTDPLTSCLNRRAFWPQFEKSWAASQRYGQALACVMVDVDHFKKINDEHGHATGDVVLQRVAALLRSLLRESDVICRYGGEEFCVLLPHTDLPGARDAAERFRAAIAAEPVGGDVRVTASLGVSTTEDAAETSAAATTPLELVDHADAALYASKHGGRNRVTAWTPQLAIEHAA